MTVYYILFIFVVSNSLIFGTQFWSSSISGLSGERDVFDPSLNPDFYTLDIFAISSVHLILRQMALHCLPIHEILCLPFVYSGVP